MISYRQMTYADVPAGISLCRSAGWNQTENEWNIFLDESPHGCIVATDQNEHVVGTATTIRYEDRFAWVGMVLVDPLRKREGIGTQLLKNAIALLKDVQCTRLDATPAGRQVYVKLGFEDEYPLSRLISKSVDLSKLPRSTARKMDVNDLDQVFHIDREVFGASRKHLLGKIYAARPDLAFVNNTFDAFCFARQGYNYLHIGPLIAPGSEAAADVLTAVLQECQGEPVIIDATHHSPGWLRWLSTAGFSEQRPFMRMFKGRNIFKGLTSHQFAILGPEFG